MKSIVISRDTHITDKVYSCTSVYINTQSLARLSVKIPSRCLLDRMKGLDRQMRRIARNTEVNLLINYSIGENNFNYE